MKRFSQYFSFMLAMTISISLIIACGDSKDPGSETKKEETKKEQTKTESTTSTSTTSGSNQLYFVEEYTSNGEEVGKSDKFFIKSKGGYNNGNA